MFARLPDLVAAVPIEIDGVAHHARAGDSIAAALLAAGVTACRVTAISGAPRAPFCVMGACFECMVEVDGRRVQGCVERVKAGMRIVTRRGVESFP